LEHRVRAILLDPAYLLTYLLDGNPVGVKYAMKLAGMDSGEMRLPLWEANEETKKTIEAQVTKLGLKAR